MAAMRRGCVTTMLGFALIQEGRWRTRSATSTSSSSSSPSKYRALMVFPSSETSKISLGYHFSSKNTSQTEPTSKFSSSSAPPSFSHSSKSSKMNCGSCVDFPLPVPPLTMTAWLRSRASLRIWRISSAGSLPLISSRFQSSSSGFFTTNFLRATYLLSSLMMRSPSGFKTISCIAAMRASWRCVASSRASFSAARSSSVPMSSLKRSSVVLSPMSGRVQVSLLILFDMFSAHSFGACGDSERRRRVKRISRKNASPACATAASLDSQAWRVAPKRSLLWKMPVKAAQ
mmetsp:Transcript_17712/g.44591  ORF Transcript_17712/g.44591 Transcript_17712/m.44591 type:complete len:288 (+) Transcript_17712:419-1282(+)